MVGAWSEVPSIAVASEETGALTASDPEQVGEDNRSLIGRLLITPDFARLWFVQVVSATGDWLGFFAIVVAAARVGGGTPEAAVSFVMTARIVPGLFLAPLAGVLVDRWNRKRVMMVCDLGRAATLAALPFVDQLGRLVVASLVLECSRCCGRQLKKRRSRTWYLTTA